MDEQRSAAISGSASTSSSAIIAPEVAVHGTVVPSWKLSGFTIVRLVLGVLLFATAGLKLSDPSPDAFSGLELLSSPRGRMAAIEVEALLSLWLLMGALPRLLWAAALSCFSFFAGASLYMGIEGQASCGCAGAKLSISPWYAMALDLVSVASLVWWRPRQGYRLDSATLRRILAVAAASGIILAVGFGGLTWIYGSPYEALFQVRGESITVEPSVSYVGEGVVGEQRTFTIQVTNHRDKSIKVIGGTTSCSCITTDNLPIIIPPRATCSIVTWVKFRGSPGRFRHSFVLYTDEERQATVTAWFTGRVIEPASP